MKTMLRLARASQQICAIMLVAGLAAVVGQAVGQDAPKEKTAPAVVPAVETQDDTSSELTVESVQTALNSIENNSNLEQAVKDLLRPKYKQAIEALKNSAGNTANLGQYKQSIATAPNETTKTNDELLGFPTVDESRANATERTNGLSSDDIQKIVDSERATVAGLADDLSNVTAEIARLKLRPAETNDRIPKAENELSVTEKKFNSPEMAADTTSPGRIADRLVLQASGIGLRTELEMLKQEQLSQSIREGLFRAQQDLLTRQLENKKAALKVFETSKNRMVKIEAKQIGSEIESILQQVPKDDLAARDLAKEVQEMTTELDQVVKNSRLVINAQDEITARLNRLNVEFDYVNSQLQLGGSGDVIAQLLFELRNRILRRGDNADLTQNLPKLDEARLADLQIDQKVRRQREIKSQFGERSSQIDDLVDLREDVLDKLQGQYKALVSGLSALQRDNERYGDKAETVLTFVYEQFFWVRSFPPVSIPTLAQLPDGVDWLLQGTHWKSFWQAQLKMARRVPFRFYGILFLTGLLLVTRHRLITALELTGVKTRRISTDRYGLTAQALLWTLLLAIPIPLMFAFLAWTTGQLTDTNDWLLGFATGSHMAAWITLFLGIVAETSRPRGLGIAHFGWSEPPFQRLRKSIFGFAVVYIPALLVTSSAMYGTNAAQYGESIGRVSFILAQVWTLIIVWRLFASPDGILKSLVQRHPENVTTRMRYVWLGLALACPLALIFLAWRGYVITAIELSTGLLATLGIFAIGDILYWMALRWFGVKKRKLALAEALERRRARKEAAALSERAEPDEVVTIDPDEDPELDLDLITDQTRHLLRMVFSLCMTIAIVLFWSEIVPIYAALENVDLPLTELSLLSVAKAILIMVVTWIAVKNLPGVIELSVLRTTSIETGTRYAISRLCQYVLIAIGLFLLFDVLHIDWTKFGWIAAALSVGLGFGLQEVVANFVCGLILLFERPVRVGDVVTLDGKTGTVTRIQMRATTITNWDRQEFIVPNKNLITGTILNWTLSASTNRVVIPIGVAYGTDTEKARQILLSVATDHPLILKEPPASTSFDQFADSSLTITLRAYLPDLDNRLKTISELHTEINNRFSAEEIEIAFPQLDLHVHNVTDSTFSGEGQAFPS